MDKFDTPSGKQNKSERPSVYTYVWTMKAHWLKTYSDNVDTGAP